VLTPADAPPPATARPAHAPQGSAPRAIKSRLLACLQPHLAALATLPAASRLVEALFVWGDVAEKRAIVEAIAPRTKELQVRHGLRVWGERPEWSGWLRTVRRRFT